jgi:hypothetical protein
VNCTCGLAEYDGPGKKWLTHGPGCLVPYRPTGWTHAEAKTHTLTERLFERCATYAQDFLPCPSQGPDLPREDWCERCLAATRLAELGDA